MATVSVFVFCGRARRPGQRPLPLKSFDRHGMVLYCNSFSKTLAPGLRIGWMAGPVGMAESLAPVRNAFDVNAVAQAAALASLDDAAAARVGMLHEVAPDEIVLVGKPRRVGPAASVSSPSSSPTSSSTRAKS